MKQYLIITGLLLLKVALVIILFLWLTGCANTQMVENLKRDAVWRAEEAESAKYRTRAEETKQAYVGAVKLEVPADLYGGPVD